MAFGRHFKALLWKNTLLWRRKLWGSLWELIFPVLMVGAIVGIRQAVSDKQYEEGNRLKNGVAYTIPDSLTSNNLGEGNEFYSLIKEEIFGGDQIIPFPINPIGGEFYTIVGKDPDEVKLMNASLTILLEPISQLIGRNFIFKEGITNEEELFDLIRSNNYSQGEKTERMLFAIGLPTDRQNNPYDYTIYMSENFPSNVPETRSMKITNIPGTENFMKYSSLGFMTLQSFIANFILKTELEDFSPSIDLFMSMGYINEFTQDDFLENFGPTLALFMLMIFIAPLFRLVSFLTEEKASRAREGMKIMGLNDAPYWLSWFVYYFSVNLVISLVTGLSFAFVLFPNSSVFFVLLWVFLYGLSLFSFAVLVSSFLQRPLIAWIIVTMFHFLTYFLVIPLEQPGVSDQIRTMFSVIPNVAMSLSAGAIGKLELTKDGLTGSTLFDNTGGFKVGIALISLAGNFIIQLLLGLYLDNVLPKQYGTRQHPCFMFKKSYWFGTRYQDANDLRKSLLDEDDQELNGENKDFEAVPPNVRKLEKTGECMKVRHLKKIYGNGKVAVNDLSLTMYKNQIFALLGHNGAGKTTTLSILTGLYQPTAGKASVFNLDMFEQVNEIRKNLGVCPQFDILFDMLTPEEHLIIYWMFKGVPVSEVDDQVEKTLRDIDLESKRKAYAKNLSGGQKRKLSVGIAMIGGSKLVLLDEPTSGMDLTARRKIWDMLKNNKQDRILILTTHFMDEADILGDRIAIMASGRIKCCGQSLFLKKRFGVGYNLIISKEDKDPNPEIEEFVFERINNCIKLSEVSSEVTFQIPQSESEKFEQFFTELDESLKQLRIKSYGVGVTTLEEVFLKVGHQDEEGNGSSPDSPKIEETKEDDSQEANEIVRINDSQRSDNDDYSIAEQSEKNVFFLHLYALCVKRFLMSFRQLKSSLLEIFIPMIFILTGLGLANIDFFVDASAVNLSMTQFPENNNLFIGTTQNGVDSQTFANSFDQDIFDINVINTPPGDNLYSTLDNFETTIFRDNNGYDGDVQNAGNFVLHNLDITPGAQKCQVFGFSNGFARDGAPIMTQNVLNSCLRILLNKPDMQLRFVNQPFPLTARAKAGSQAGSGSIIGFLFAIAFAMIPTGVAYSVVHERETNVKHQQMISGASIIPYWISNYLVDFTRSMIPMGFAIIMVFVFSVDLPFIWLHFVLFALAIHPFTYATTFIFKKQNLAQTMTIIINIFLGGFIPITIIVLQSIQSTRSVGQALRWVPKIFPSFSVVNGILQISIRNIFAFAAGLDAPDDSLSFDVAGGDAVFLAFNIFFWWGVVILLETGFLGKLFSCRRYRSLIKETTDEPEAEIDSDVREEEYRCADINPNDCSVLVNQLRKEFKVNGEQLVAVKNIWFGLEYGEWFALLGVNGAGKSTTFKSMTGDIIPTSGKIYIDGLDLSSAYEFSQARKLIGYCPQENAIFEGMTVYEHLVFYARIKGIVSHKRNDIINNTMKEMDLEQFKNVRCEKLSGGNKRKLSVAMAIIGNPPIVFLDEPSTGMDPRAKRFMWTIISRISTLRKKSTVILTTHSMEEAEALCTKMGIMVNGRFKCLGSSQEIKNKYGTGYEVEIKIQWPTEEEAATFARNNDLNPEDSIGIEQLQDTLIKLKVGTILEEPQITILENEIEKNGELTIESLCQLILLEKGGLTIKKALKKNTSKCQLIEHYNNFFKFRVERGQKSLGFFFGFMESLKSQVNFEEYGVSQTTLEQIFNAFAKGQEVEGASKNKGRKSLTKDIQ